MKDFTHSETFSAPAERLDLRGLVEDLLKGQAEKLKAAKASVQVDFHSCVMVAERARLEQVLNNLLSNGLKFHRADAPDPVVTIRACQQGEMVSIQVVDNGIGVDPTLGDTIYDMFVRGNSEYAGAGLGLYVVAQAVIFVPLLYIAKEFHPGVIPAAVSAEVSGKGQTQGPRDVTGNRIDRLGVAGKSRRLPRTGTPWMVVPALRRSSSTKPMGL